MCKNKLERLIISGNPTIEELNRAKMDISGEFSLLTGNLSALSYLDRTENIIKISNEITILTVAHKLISEGIINERVTECLKKIKTNTTDLEKIKSKIELKTLQLRKLQAEEKNSKKEGGENKKQDVSFYSSLIATVSRFSGFRITREITLLEFSQYIKQMQEQIKAQQQIKRK